MHHLRMNKKFFTQCIIIALSVCDGFKIVQSGTPEKVADTEHSNTPHQVYPRSFGIFSRPGHESRHEGSLFGHIGNVLAPVRGIIDHAKKFIPGHHQPHPAKVPYDEDHHPGGHHQERPNRPYQERPNKHDHVGPNRPYDGRPHGRPHQPNHERPHYERPHERPHRPHHERPHNERPYERPHLDRPHRPHHERPHNERPYERPHHDRPHRPHHERPHRPNQERPSYDDYPDGSYDDRPNKDSPYEPGQQQPNRQDNQRPNRPDNQRPNRPGNQRPNQPGNQRPNKPGNQRPRPPIKEEVDYEDYEDTKVDKQPPSWEDIGEHPNRDIPYEDIIQPRRRPKRFIESKIYHVPLQFRSNAKPYKVKFKKEKRVAKH